MITPEKIKVYDSFDGDEDGLERIGNSKQQLLFDESDDWYMIRDFYQDIHLINNKLASSDYAKKVVAQIKKQCDSDAYRIFISKIIQH